MPSNVSVLVTYAYGYAGPFERDYPADTPIATARDAAIKHFRLEYEPATTYHLTIDEVRVPELATIGQVAGDAPTVALKLVRS